MAKSKVKVTKPKLRGSWGCKVEGPGAKTEAQAAPGVAKPNIRRASGSTWGRSRELWAGYGRSRGVRGRSREISGPNCSFLISGQKFKIVKKNLPIRPKAVPNNLFDYFLRLNVSGPAGQAGLVGSRKPLCVAQFRYAPDF